MDLKKILLFLIGILFLPLSVEAMDVSEPFSIGDRVRVLLENDQDGVEFFVIKPSVAYDPYVWLILNQNVESTAGKSITVFDEITPGEHEDLTIWGETIAHEVLLNATEHWRSEVTRLLQEQDLIDLGLKKNTATGEYEIMANRREIAPIVLSEYPTLENPESAYNYWTQIYDESAENTSVFAVILNENYSGDTLTPLAYVKSRDITSIDNNYEYVIRPVIKIHKMYIDCKIGDTTTVASPPTGEVTMPFEVISLIIIGGVAYYLVRKKDMFEKI